MNLLILLGLIINCAWSKPLVMISYFDAFNGSKFNNSEIIARAIEESFKVEHSPLGIQLCALNTIFDKAYGQLEDCINGLPTMPIMVISLGESNCGLKVETIMRNIDKSILPDNAGQERHNSVIIEDAPRLIGMRYPLPNMYCELNETQRKDITISNSAGSFVCNNTGFQMSYYHPELPYGLIHVPANTCKDLEQKNKWVIQFLQKMISKGAAYLSSSHTDYGLPHTKNNIQLPTTKKDIKILKNYYQHESCLKEYFKRSKSAEEKGLFSLGINN
jgi:pyrrolidone-carboxylate peptidase